jgi:addiction module RelE/StbE family toxin
VAAVRWTQRARDDLRDIHDFIARDSPRAAEALVERLLTATERLAAFPESGRIVPEFPALGYREIIVSSYRVLYWLADNAVWITAVVHGRRLLRGEPDNA